MLSSHLRLSPMERGEDGAHPSPKKRSCQHQLWYFHTRFTWIHYTARPGMTNCLAPEEVSCQRQIAPQWRCLSAGIPMKAYEISVQGSLAHLVMVPQRSNPGASCSATRRHGQTWPARQTGGLRVPTAAEFCACLMFIFLSTVGDEGKPATSVLVREPFST